MISKNLEAFLDMIAWSEIGPYLLKNSDNGYNVLVGGKLFFGYNDHPRTLVPLSKLGLSSTAAGRYQLLSRYYDAYKKSMGLIDFSPANQDRIAIQQIREQGAMKYIEAGKIPEAIDKVKNIWASLPGAGYGQHEQKLAKLLSVYIESLTKRHSSSI